MNPLPLTHPSPTVETSLDLVRAVPFFRTLADADAAPLIGFFHERKFAKGDYLFWEGDAADWMYVIRSGKVRMFKSSPNGKEINLEIMAPGEFCGGGAIYVDVQPASAQALTETVACGIRKTDFQEVLTRHPRLAQEVIAYLGQKLMSAHDMILSLITSRVENRVASLLVRLAEHHGTKTPEGVRINIALTRQNIADVIGSTVETTIRVMRRFEREKILGTREGRIMIFQLDRLQKMQFAQESGPSKKQRK